MKKICPTCLTKQHLLRPVGIWLTMLLTMVVLYFTKMFRHLLAFNACSIWRTLFFIWKKMNCSKHGQGITAMHGDVFTSKETSNAAVWQWDFGFPSLQWGDIICLLKIEGLCKPISSWKMLHDTSFAVLGEKFYIVVLFWFHTKDNCWDTCSVVYWQLYDFYLLEGKQIYHPPHIKINYFMISTFCQGIIIGQWSLLVNATSELV